MSLRGLLDNTFEERPCTRSYCFRIHILLNRVRPPGAARYSICERLVDSLALLRIVVSHDNSHHVWLVVDISAIPLRTSILSHNYSPLNRADFLFEERRSTCVRPAGSLALPRIALSHDSSLQIWLATDISAIRLRTSTLWRNYSLLNKAGFLFEEHRSICVRPVGS
jgi:hypothetical protein